MGKMIIVKSPMHTKTPCLIWNPGHCSDTLNTQFIPALIGRWYQYFDSNTCSFRRTLSTEDQGSIQRDIVGESSFCMLGPVAPVVNDWKSKFVSNRGSSLQSDLIHQEEMHA